MGKKAKNATFISGIEAGKISKEIQKVEKRRIVKSTQCNERSSRSHCMVYASQIWIYLVKNSITNVYKYSLIPLHAIILFRILMAHLRITCHISFFTDNSRCPNSGRTADACWHGWFWKHWASRSNRIWGKNAGTLSKRKEKKIRPCFILVVYLIVWLSALDCSRSFPSSYKITVICVSLEIVDSKD